MERSRSHSDQVGHRRRLWAALVCAGGIGASLASLMSTADALFLSRVGGRHLGTAFAVSAALSMLVLWGVGGLADRRDRGRLLRFGSGIAVVLVALVLSIDLVFPRLSATMLLIVGKQIGGGLELLLWVVIAERFTAREARKLLPWVVVANGGGAALGAISVGPVARALGSMGPIWISLLLLILVAIAAQLLMQAPDQRIAQHGIRLNKQGQRSGIEILRERPLAQWLAMLVAAAGIFAPMMYYLLSVGAAAEFPDEVDLAGFLGRYRAYVQGAALVAQVLIAPWLSKRLGVGLMLILAPLGAIVTAIVVGFHTGFLVIALAQALTRILDTAIQTPAEQLIQNLLPQEVRGRVAGLVGGIAKRSGAIVGGIAASLLIVQPGLFAIAIVLSALLWFVIAGILWRRFAEMAVAELTDVSQVKGDDGEFALRFANERGLRQLRKRLRSTEGREQENAIALLRRLDALDKASAVDELIDAMTRCIKRASQLRFALRIQLGEDATIGTDARNRALELLKSQQVAERELAIEVLGCATLDATDLNALTQACERSRTLASEIAMLRHNNASVLERLIGAGHGADVIHQLRCEIARAHLGLSCDVAEDLAERLLRCLSRCPSADLQVAGLHSVVSSMAAGRPTALRVLLAGRLTELSLRWRNSPEPALREASLVAWEAGGEEECRPYVNALADRDESVRRRADTLLREAGERALSILSIASQSGRRRVRLAAVDILADLRPSQNTLDALLERELGEMVRCSRNKRALIKYPNGSLVRRRLSERINESVEAALMTLEARTSNRGIGEVARRLARASSERARARSLEALDALLPRKTARTILGAIEGTLTGICSASDAIQSELAGADRLTRDLLVHSLDADGRATYRDSINAAAKQAEHVAASIDPVALVERLMTGEYDSLKQNVPSILETIVALSELPLFADLSTTQLEDLAATVTWEQLRGGETLIEQGEEATCMYFVQSGELEVFVDDKSVALLRKGEPIGELGLFSEDRRSAKVISVDNSQVGQISRVDMENLIEDVPGVGLRLCRAMSRRLAQSNRPSADTT